MAFLDEGRLQIDRQALDLAALVDQVVNVEQLHAAEAGIDLSVDSTSKVPMVLGDHLRLFQVVENLITNGLKFTRAGGSVQVRVRAARTMAILEVCDTGTGIAPEEIPHLFDRLYRTPAAIAAHVPGVGLGLPIVKRSARQARVSGLHGS